MKFIFLFLVFLFPNTVLAITDTERAIAYVVCDRTRQGSGALISSDGYVATAGHVVIDAETKSVASGCTVSFPTNDSLKPLARYDATVVHAVFDRRKGRDFAVLKLQEGLLDFRSLPSPILTDEFLKQGNSVRAYGFPGGSNPTLKTESGIATGFARGIVETTAKITEGFSGGPLLNSNNHLVGIATQVSFTVDPQTGARTGEVYEFGDVLSFEYWLDTFGIHAHDTYVKHADETRVNSAPFLLRTEETLGCAHVVRLVDFSTLYCLLSGPERLVFPNEATYFSWFPDFRNVKFITQESLSQYTLIGNVTMKPNSLIKIQTDPRVYVVVSSVGDMRHVATEEVARTHFGPDWAKKVRDVPDAFFVDYAWNGGKVQ